jgi:hypothetical protein
MAKKAITKARSVLKAQPQKKHKARNRKKKKAHNIMD